MKNILIIILLAILPVFALASMSKIYVGSEEGQAILGIESISGDNDGGGGLEIRTYFRKKGILVNDEEYGSIPRKTKYILMLGGTTPEGGILKFKQSWAFSKADGYFEKTALTKASIFEIGHGQGQYLLYN